MVKQSARRLAYHVTVADENGEPVTYGPDSDVPAAVAKQITNPSAWADEDGESAAEDGDDGQEPEEKAKPYSEWLKADLEAEVDRRNEGRDEDDLIEVEGRGKVADLVAALEADDVAQSDQA